MKQRVLLAVGVMLAGLVTPAAAHAADAFEYVALGDSSAAGPLILPQIDLPCLRASANYPHVAAAELGARLTDVTCSGAAVKDFSGKQFGFVPPQYKALKPTTDLVTVAIGANDSGLFQAALSCLNLLPQPAGISCKARYTAGGKDQLAASIDASAPALGKALARIHELAPNARILVTGYGTYLRPGGCYPQVPVWPADGDYLQGVIDHLNRMIATQSAANGATYVDLRTPSIGHDTCAPESQRWLEGLIPGSDAAPLHPSRRGMAAFGALVAAAAK